MPSEKCAVMNTLQLYTITSLCRCKGPPNAVSTGQVCMQHHTIYSIYYVQVELDPELAKNENWIFLKRINISANQMISGDSKSVNNRHV